MPAGGMSPEFPTHSSARLRDALLVLLMAAALLLPTIGRHPIVTSHEARFALIAGDMRERGVWFEAAVRGVPYRNKPPLHPWSIVASSWLTGRVNEVAAQLPSALATIATVLGVFLLGDRLFGRRVGAWAAAVHATSYGVFAHSQMILPDLPMVAFGVLAGYFFWRAIATPGDRMAMVGFYLMLALGVFTKGPAGLLPLAVAVVWLWTEHGVSGLRKLWSLPGAALFVALSLVWLVPFLTAGSGDRFVGRVLWSDWLYHYFRLPRPGAVGGQLFELAVGLAPWTLVLPFAAVHAARTRREPAARFAILWLVVQGVVIMASTTQRVRYLLPLYPGAALLVAWWAFDGRRTHRAYPALAAAGALALVLAVVAAGVVAPPAGLSFRPSWLVPLAGALVVALGLAAGLWLGRPAVLVRAVAVGMAVALASGVWLYNDWIHATRNVKTLAASIERHAEGREAGVFVSKGEYLQIDFYLGRHLKTIGLLAELTDYLARPERPVVVVNQENWERWHRQLPPEIDVVETTVVAGETMRLVRLKSSRPPR